MWFSIKTTSSISNLNKIYVKHIKEENKITLEYPKCNIKTKEYIGEKGFTKEKKEGDGKTPIGEYKLGIILGKYPKEKVKTKLKYMQITKDMYWVDDPKSIYYNQLVDISKIEQKDWNSAEHLIDYPIEYEYLIEIKVNPNNIPPKGSAIFLHCTNNKPTKGCIAIDRYILRKIVENVDENTKIQVL